MNKLLLKSRNPGSIFSWWPVCDTQSMPFSNSFSLTCVTVFVKRNSNNGYQCWIIHFVVVLVLSYTAYVIAKNTITNYLHNDNKLLLQVNWYYRNEMFGICGNCSILHIIFCASFSFTETVDTPLSCDIYYYKEEHYPAHKTGTSHFLGHFGKRVWSIFDFIC